MLGIIRCGLAGCQLRRAASHILKYDIGRYGVVSVFRPKVVSSQSSYSFDDYAPLRPGPWYIPRPLPLRDQNRTQARREMVHAFKGTSEKRQLVVEPLDTTVFGTGSEIVGFLFKENNRPAPHVAEKVGAYAQTKNVVLHRYRHMLFTKFSRQIDSSVVNYLIKVIGDALHEL
jgi:hypothetical protein